MSSEQRSESARRGAPQMHVATLMQRDAASSCGSFSPSSRAKYGIRRRSEGGKRMAANPRRFPQQAPTESRCNFQPQLNYIFVMTKILARTAEMAPSTRAAPVKQSRRGNIKFPVRRHAAQAKACAALRDCKTVTDDRSDAKPAHRPGRTGAFRIEIRRSNSPDSPAHRRC
jgi:hypothetical protein